MTQSKAAPVVKGIRAHHRKHKKRYQGHHKKAIRRIDVLRAQAKAAGAKGMFSWLGRFKRWVFGHGKKGLKAAAEIVKKEASVIAQKAKEYGAAKLKEYGGQVKEKIGNHYNKLKDKVSTRMNAAEAKVQSTIGKY